MPIFEVQGPDGSTYEIDAPDEGAALGAFQRFSGPQESQQSHDLRTELSSLTQNPNTADFDRRQFDSLPTWQKPIVAASDMLQLGARGATFGFGDKAVAAARAPFTDKTYAEELEGQRALTQSARNRAGSAGAAAEIGGSVGTGLGLAGRGATLAGRFGSAGMEGAKGLAARTALMGAEGAGYGAVNALGNDQDVGTGALIGAAGGAGGNLIGEGVSKGISTVAGAFNKKPVIPGREELEALKNASYDAAERAGVIFSPDAVNRINTKVVGDLTDMGFDGALMPGASAALRRLRELNGQNVTMKGLDTVRKVASNGYVVGNDANNRAVAKIIEAIDDVMTSPAKGEILMGKGQEGILALRQARNYASRTAKLDKVEQSIQKAQWRAGSTGSGGNTDNATRQNLRRLLEKPRGFTPDERKALETAVMGSGGQNALRLAGKLSPQGNGLMAALGIGGTMVNPAVGALSLGGMAAKAVADRLTQSNVKALTDIIAAGGKKSATQASNNAVQRLAESKSDLIARGILGYALERARNQAPAQ